MATQDDLLRALRVLRAKGYRVVSAATVAGLGSAAKAAARFVDPAGFVAEFRCELSAPF